MTDCENGVKGFRRRFVEWIDCHPRMGWYIAGWATLISFNAVLNILDILFRALG